MQIASITSWPEAFAFVVTVALIVFLFCYAIRKSAED